MKKRLLAFILVCTLMLSTVVTHVSAESAKDFSVRVSDTTATAGDSRVAVDILLENNPGLAGFSFCVDFDTDKLVLVESEISIEGGYQVVSHPTDHGVNLAWTDIADYHQNGKIATLYFNIPKDATAGDAVVEITYRDGYDSFYDANEADYEVKTVNGKVTVAPLTETEDPAVNVGTESVNFGETDIIIPITVTNNPGFSGFSFCINYDTSRLILDDADIVIDGGYEVISHPEGYGVGLAWTNVTPYTSNGTIVELHFSVKDAAVSGKGYINIAFRDGYDSFYAFIDGTEQDIAFASYDGYIDINDHKFGEWEITVPATCTSTGLKTRTCSDCQKVETAVIPKTDHEYIAVVTDPTCIAKGYTTHSCKNCTDYFIDSYVDMIDHTPGQWEQSIAPECEIKGEEVQKCTVCDAIVNKREIAETGHTYGDWHVTSPATFNEDGEERRDCQNCDHYETRKIPKFSDSHICSFTGAEEVIKEATCTESGSKKVYCSEPECGKHTIVEIAAAGHRLGEWYTVKDATFDTDGLERCDCEKCDYYETRTIPKLSDSHICSYTGREEIIEQPTCTTSGTKRIYCIDPNCGKYITENIEPTGHTEGEWEVAEPPTCTVNGKEVLKCVICFAELRSKPIEATGHQWDSGEITKQPSCLNEGEKTFHCVNCTETEVKPIAKTGHTGGEWETVKEASCTEPGTKERRCTVCHDLIGTEVIPSTGHVFGSWVVTVPPTVTEAGEKTRECSVCHAKETSPIDPTGTLPKIVVSNAVGSVGNTVTVTISLQDNPGIITAYIRVLYDATKLQLISAEDTGLLNDAIFSNNLSLNPYVLCWDDALAHSNNTASGEIAILTFKILQTDACVTDIVVLFEEDEIYDTNLDPVFFETQNGQVEIVDFIFGDVDGDGIVNIKDVTLLRRYVAKWEGVTINLLAADVNGDGVVNIRDVTILRRYVAKWEGYDNLPYTG